MRRALMAFAVALSFVQMQLAATDVQGQGIAPVVIVNDRGGNPFDYLAWSRAVVESGAAIKIRGLCASSCTLILLAPADRVCVAAGAQLLFHGVKSGVKDVGEAMSLLFLRLYPPGIRAWIENRGGLSDRLLSLAGGELRRFYKPCKAPWAPRRHRPEPFQCYVLEI